MPKMNEDGRWTYSEDACRCLAAAFIGKYCVHHGDGLSKYCDFCLCEGVARDPSTGKAVMLPGLTVPTCECDCENCTSGKAQLAADKLTLLDVAGGRRNYGFEGPYVKQRKLLL